MDSLLRVKLEHEEQSSSPESDWLDMPSRQRAMSCPIDSMKAEDDDDNYSPTPEELQELGIKPGQKHGSLKIRRKLRKMAREKQKRLMLNDKFDELCSVLRLGRNTRVEKLTILNEAIREVQQLKNENGVLRGVPGKFTKKPGKQRSIASPKHISPTQSSVTEETFSATSTAGVSLIPFDFPTLSSTGFPCPQSLCDDMMVLPTAAELSALHPDWNQSDLMSEQLSCIIPGPQILYPMYVVSDFGIVHDELSFKDMDLGSDDQPW